MAMSSWFQQRAKTVKTNKKRGPHDSLLKFADSTLGSVNVQLAVTLPEGEDQNEWLAANTVDFFNQINMLYGVLAELCTAETCPTMSAGPKYEYHWADGEMIKKAIRVSAPEYVEYLMSWVQKNLDDERVFPARIGAPFPSNFFRLVKQMFRRMFRVYAHMYHHHYEQIVALGLDAHLNTSLQHFMYFVKEFRLMEEKELAPLGELIASLCA
eukprot:TRINITY_DN3497_c0_g1_i2.p1 TRINITY_DN3497_c0_g1~~TRINITY_DN3497_c0_g1_i2.p1  ORF type:complete len:212 (-),score=89.31 TRINITY_DN3497_c0_g1_i2:744-1379(-)